MPIFMPAPKFRLLLGMLSILVAAGCGTGGGSSTLNQPMGNFSAGTLNGSYVYQIHGLAFNGNLGTFIPYREIGVFTADGAGNITAGTDDSSFGATGTAITGSYSVSSAGIGTVTFNTSSLGIPLNFGITVSSSSQVQMIEINNTLNGSAATLNGGGTAQLQDPAAAGTTPTGSFVFRLHQDQSAQNTNEEASEVGAFTLSGGNGSGAMDQDFNATFTASPDLITMAFNAPLGGRGTGTLDDTTASFVTDFVYYVVNSGQLLLLVDNGGAVGSGSAEAQTGVSSSTGLSGSYAFGSRGDDVSTGTDGVAAVGQFTATSGAISGTQDTMVDGNFTGNQNFSSCFAVGSAGGMNGRVSVIASGSAPCSGTPSQVFWMVNPNRAFFLDNSGLTFQDGIADLQTTNSFSASTFKGQFALGMDGVDLVNGQTLSRVGAMQFDGSKGLNLSEDTNSTLNGFNQQAVSGTYSASSNGRVTGTLNGGGLDIVMYAVSGSQAYILQGNSGFITSGTLLLQQ